MTALLRAVHPSTKKICSWNKSTAAYQGERPVSVFPQDPSSFSILKIYHCSRSVTSTRRNTFESSSFRPHIKDPGSYPCPRARRNPWMLRGHPWSKTPSPNHSALLGVLHRTYRWSFCGSSVRVDIFAFTTLLLRRNDIYAPWGSSHIKYLKITPILVAQSLSGSTIQSVVALGDMVFDGMFVFGVKVLISDALACALLALSTGRKASRQLSHISHERLHTGGGGRLSSSTSAIPCTITITLWEPPAVRLEHVLCIYRWDLQRQPYSAIPYIRYCIRCAITNIEYTKLKSPNYTFNSTQTEFHSIRHDECISFRDESS